MIQLNAFREVEKSHRGQGLKGDRCKAVLAALRKFGKGGATTEELAKWLGLERVQVGPRLAELRHWGYVHKTEARRCGGIVWVAGGIHGSR